MFTGLIEEVAVVRRIVQGQAGARLEIEARRALVDIHLGDSIAVNGVCLTVTGFSASTFTADAVPETMRRTNLGRLRPTACVNVERALRVGDRLGGHIVSGHVDGVGRLQARTPEGSAIVLTVAADLGLIRYIAEKGSICVDGVSLTVMDVGADAFRVSVIPHTGTATTLLSSPLGAEMNLECDVIAKYVERLLGLARPGGAQGQSVVASSGTGDVSSPDADRFTMDFLRQNGFA